MRSRPSIGGVGFHGVSFDDPLACAAGLYFAMRNIDIVRRAWLLPFEL